jgi:Uma2 family endonuclease
MTTSSPIRPTTATRYQTAAEWVRDLGDVPLERIIFDPWPGTATEADLLRKVEVEKHLCELIEGTLVEKGMGLLESMIALRLAQLLLNFVLPRKLGVVTGPDGTIRFSKGIVRLPDVSFVSYERLPGGKVPTESIPSLVPDLAVEVVSKSNTNAEMARKTGEYFRAGVTMVWIIDPASRSARIFTGPDDVEQVSGDGVLRGVGVLEGFEVTLTELFAVLDEAP